MLNPIQDLFIGLCKNFNDSCKVPKVDLDPKLSEQDLNTLKKLLADAESSYDILSKSEKYKNNKKIKSLKAKIDVLKSKILELSV
jgi:lipid II:glycine glycyltransferase (peptidoglycan interpeptide bridge formation enzyme)